MSRKIKTLLYLSFDNELNTKEKQILKKALQESEHLRQEKEIIETLRAEARQSAAKNFSSGFADRVMKHVAENHHEEEMLFESLFTFFRPVAVAAILLLIGLTLYNIITTEELSLEGAYAISEVSIEEAFDPIVDLTAE